MRLVIIYNLLFSFGIQVILGFELSGLPNQSNSVFCKKGEYFIKDSETEKERCKSCKDGFYMAKHHHQEQSCIPCFKPSLGLGKEIAINCTRTNDYVVDCDKNHFKIPLKYGMNWRYRIFHCSKCTDCRDIGMFEIAKCTRRRDTICVSQNTVESLCNWIKNIDYDPTVIRHSADNIKPNEDYDRKTKVQSHVTEGKTKVQSHITEGPQSKVFLETGQSLLEDMIQEKMCSDLQNIDPKVIILLVIASFFGGAIFVIAVVVLVLWNKGYFNSRSNPANDHNSIDDMLSEQTQPLKKPFKTSNFSSDESLLSSIQIPNRRIEDSCKQRRNSPTNSYL